MFHTLLSTQRSQFNTLAKAWLNSGATAVIVWNDDGTLDRWPADSAPQSTDFIEPIRIGNQTIGEIRVAGYTGAVVHQQLAFTTSLLSYLAQLEFELELAKQVQRGFLPTPPAAMVGLQIWAESRPARQVGGDYYDLIQPTPNQLIFAVGDIVNKGISAALLMAVLHKVIRTGIKLAAPPTPAAILAYTSADMYEEFDRAAMFATAFLGHFDGAKRTVTYCNAGHAPVIYRPARGAARLLPADYAPLGVMQQRVYTEQTLCLGPGDLLIVATDGLVEASDWAGQRFGYDKLLAVVDRLADRSAQELAVTLLAAVAQFSGNGIQEDDQTVLILKGT